MNSNGLLLAGLVALVLAVTTTTHLSLAGAALYVVAIGLLLASLVKGGRRRRESAEAPSEH